MNAIGDFGLLILAPCLLACGCYAAVYAIRLGVHLWQSLVLACCYAALFVLRAVIATNHAGQAQQTPRRSA